MIIELHMSSHSREETIVYDTSLRCEIEHVWLDHGRIEVDEAYAETAGVMFIHAPLNATPKEVQAMRLQALRGY